MDQIKKGSVVECTEALSSQEAAKLQVSLAYTLASLYIVLLKASGKDASSDSDISHEMDRIKQYVVKLNSKRPNNTNIEVAKRMINHHL
jgi:uncharacterized protein (DUF305 family)